MYFMCISRLDIGRRSAWKFTDSARLWTSTCWGRRRRRRWH